MHTKTPLDRNSVAGGHLLSRHAMFTRCALQAEPSPPRAARSAGHLGHRECLLTSGALRISSNTEHERGINQREPRRTRSDRNRVSPRGRSAPAWPPHPISRCSRVGRSPNVVTLMLRAIVNQIAGASAAEPPTCFVIRAQPVARGTTVHPGTGTLLGSGSSARNRVAPRTQSEKPHPVACVGLTRRLSSGQQH